MQVLIIGSDAARVFTETLEALRSVGPAVTVRTVGVVKECERWPAAELVVVLQQWPEEYTRVDAVHLIDAAPLSRLVVCYGPWCDSDGRTRDIWPQGSRIPVAAAPATLLGELAEIQQGSPPLPHTASRNESYRHAQSQPPSMMSAPLSIGVCGFASGLTGCLQDVLSAAGHSIVEPCASRPDLLLWDADPWDDFARGELTDLQAASPGTPVVALCGFPRLHTTRELLAAGAAAVVLKSVDNHTLVDQLEQAAAGRHIVRLASAGGA